MEFSDSLQFQRTKRVTYPNILVSNQISEIINQTAFLPFASSKHLWTRTFELCNVESGSCLWSLRYSGFLTLQVAFPGKQSFVQTFTCIINNCQIFQNSKTTVQSQLRIQCSHCSSSCWISLWVYLWLFADVFRHCCTEKGLFGCKKPDSRPGLHAEVRTSHLLTSSLFFPLSNMLFFALLLWSEFRVLLPCPLFFFLKSKVLF